jgi:hypothetical protein
LGLYEEQAKGDKDSDAGRNHMPARSGDPCLFPLLEIPALLPLLLPSESSSSLVSKIATPLQEVQHQQWAKVSSGFFGFAVPLLTQVPSEFYQGLLRSCSANLSDPYT